MKSNMRQLLHHLETGNYSTEDVCTIIDVLKLTGRAKVDFYKASTPEQEALARWSLEDARKEWHKVARTYDLPFHEPQMLY